VLILALLVLWEALPRSGAVEPRYLPPISAVTGALVHADDELLAAAATTLRTWGEGFVLAVVIGVAVGAAMGFLRRVDDALNVTVELLRPMPSVATIPIAIVMLGLGDPMKLSVSAFAATWPILVNTVYGVQAVDPQQIDAARTFGLSRAETLRAVMLPAAAPFIATGLRLAAGIALIVVVTAEMVASPSGLGFYIVNAMHTAQTERMYAAVLVVAALGYALNEGLTRVEARALAWHLRRSRLERSIL
jgi:ABC-type nitrate/sulfonate/bicarbonate transport system permease component